jgi:hypothetical protein
MIPCARHLVGKKIVAFHANPWPDSRGGTAHNPVIVLNDGTELHFVVEETNTGEYGVLVSRCRSKLEGTRR